ncbi:MAG: hypothetical protein DHS20C18_13440 [Saprospiraceae bacterium]|nr:MAG: hypothetical protein DHS20C18_13440 [Saprospiraceae bacterium]
MEIILIFSEQPSSRLTYILDVLLIQLLNVDYKLTHQPEVFTRYIGPKVNYSPYRLTTRELHIPPAGLLFETSIRNHCPQVEQSVPFPVFYNQPNDEADFSYDALSMCFYLLSRYEEYLPHQKDAHGRFPASASLASKHNFLHLPIVNLWLKEFRNRLKQYFPTFEIKRPIYQFHATYDIDLAWAFQHRGVLINSFGALKDLLQGNWQKLRLRYQVLNNKLSDPFDTYQFIIGLHQHTQLSGQCFFLLGDYGRFDKNIAPRKLALQELIQQTSQQFCIGLHPSYRSNDKVGQLAKEVSRLEHITGKSVLHSRQHFLKVNLPKTYQELLKVGIRHDYSMGYAAKPGFRAGIAGPFPWYDLERERATLLQIHPFQVMDVGLKNYLHLDPEQALSTIKPILQIVKDTGGVFSTLWHNSSFAEEFGWAGWRDMYKALLEMGAERE